MQLIDIHEMCLRESGGMGQALTNHTVKLMGPASFIVHGLVVSLEAGDERHWQNRGASLSFCSLGSSN